METRVSIDPTLAAASDAVVAVTRFYSKVVAEQEQEIGRLQAVDKVRRQALAEVNTRAWQQQQQISGLNVALDEALKQRDSLRRVRVQRSAAVKEALDAADAFVGKDTEQSIQGARSDYLRLFRAVVALRADRAVEPEPAPARPAEARAEADGPAERDA